MPVKRYPRFYTPDLRNVAVLPFTAAETAEPTAEEFATRLAGALQANGTYKVIWPEDLSPAAKAMDDGKLPAALADDDALDAVLTGSVTTDSRQVEGERYEVDREYYHGSYHYGYGPYYGPYYHPPWHGAGLGYTYRAPYSYHFQRNEAHVSATARMVNVPSGEVLKRTAGPINVTLFDEGNPPDRSRAELMDRAMALVIRQLVDEFAVTHGKVRVDPGEVLRLAASEPAAGGEWKTTDDFGPKDTTMYLVVRLPDAADRNEFRITITRQKGPKELRRPAAEIDFTWRTRSGKTVHEVSLDDLRETAGPGQYRIRFYSELQAKAVFDRDFDLK
jgi:hypothetical protein